MATKPPRIDEVTLLGIAFIRWGLGLFIFGLIVGYAPLMHYLHGALVEMGEASLPNAALWLTSPYAVQIGALGMVSIGAVYGLLPAEKLEAEVSRLQGAMAMRHRTRSNLRDRLPRIFCPECDLANLLQQTTLVRRRECCSDSRRPKRCALYDRRSACVPIDFECHRLQGSALITEISACLKLQQTEIDESPLCPVRKLLFCARPVAKCERWGRREGCYNRIQVPSRGMFPLGSKPT